MLYNVTEHRYIPGISYSFETIRYEKAHIHTELSLIWVLEGQLFVRKGKEIWTAEPGDMILINPMEVHETKGADKGCICLSLMMQPSFFERAYPISGQICFDIPGRIVFEDGKDEQRVKETIEAALLNYIEKKPGFELRCSGYFHLLMGELLSLVPSHIMTVKEGTEVQKICRRMEMIIGEVETGYMRKIQLSDIAKKENLSVGYLSHFVKKHLHQSFQEYVDSVRFEKACQLISDTSLRLLDISEMTGFSDYRYFTKAFVKRIGKKPDEYRIMKRVQARSEVTDDKKAEMALFERFFVKGQNIREKEGK